MAHSTTKSNQTTAKPVSSSTVASLNSQVKQLQQNLNDSVKAGTVSGGKVVNDRVVSTNVVTPEKLTTVGTPVIPPKPQVSDMGNVTGANNALFTGLEDYGKTYNASTGLFEAVPTDEAGFQNNLEQHLNNLIGLNDSKQTNESIQRGLDKEYGIKQKEQAVSNYTGQLNSIVANRDAQVISLEGTGRGQTTGFIGGEQGRINREAAISALPVQAQLSAAQGDLQMAQAHVDKLFQIRSQDAQMEFQFKSKIADSLFAYANESQQRAINTKKEADARAYDEKKTNLAYANDWAKTAIEYGQSGLAGRIMGLDQNSPTFSTELAKLQGQVRKPVVDTSGDNVQFISATANQPAGYFNKSTGLFTPLDGTNGQGNQDIAKAQSVQTVNQIDSVLNNKAISSAVGTSGLSRSTGGVGNTILQGLSLFGLPAAISGVKNKLSGQQQDFVGGVKQITGQLTVDKLVQAKSNGATFGALSDGERELLAGSASKIGTWEIKDKNGNVVGYNASESSVKKELDTIKNFAKLDALNKGVQPEEINVVVQPDGTYWTQDSFGNLTKLK